MTQGDDIYKFYKIYRSTSMLDDDIKGIKKINNLICKYNNTGRDHYFLEAINLLKIANNIFEVNKKFVKLIKDSFIDPDNARIFNQIVKEADLWN